MRVVRALLLTMALTAATYAVGSAAVAPIVEGWKEVTGASPAGDRSAASELTVLLTGGCALLLLLAWLWLLAAVGVCTHDALRAGAGPPPASVLRPRLVRALVATVLGAAALAVPPAAHADSTRTQGNLVPHDVIDASPAGHTTGRRVLAGLPVPDRSVGGVIERADDPPPDRADDHTADRTDDPVSRLQVRPGDSLWSLTAALLPAGAPAGTVVAGWRLLYAANRAVVGPDPDLLLPGQSLRVDRALLDLVAATGPPQDAARRAPAE